MDPVTAPPEVARTIQSRRRYRRHQALPLRWERIMFPSYDKVPRRIHEALIHRDENRLLSSYLKRLDSFVLLIYTRDIDPNENVGSVVRFCRLPHDTDVSDRSLQLRHGEMAVVNCRDSPRDAVDYQRWVPVRDFPSTPRI